MVQNDDNKRIFMWNKNIGVEPSPETENDKSTAAVGADLCVCPPPKREMTADQRIYLGDRAGNLKEGEHIGSPLQQHGLTFDHIAPYKYTRGLYHEL